MLQGVCDGMDPLGSSHTRWGFGHAEQGLWPQRAGRPGQPSAVTRGASFTSSSALILNGFGVWWARGCNEGAGSSDGCWRQQVLVAAGCSSAGARGSVRGRNCGFGSTTFGWEPAALPAVSLPGAVQRSGVARGPLRNAQSRHVLLSLILFLNPHQVLSTN